MTENLFAQLYADKCKDSLNKAEEIGMLIGLIGFAIRNLDEKNLSILKKVIDSSNLSSHTLLLITKYY